MIFDFDGVIVDGMPEYWLSARNACTEVLNAEYDSRALPNQPPEAFRRLRPWVHHGWEMVLLAAEIIRPNSPLSQNGATFFSDSYQANCTQALNVRNWKPNQLQSALENVRRKFITKNKDEWLHLHKPFPGVIKRLNQLDNEGCEWAVVTTKGLSFTKEILNCFQLTPKRIYGHEAGTKPEVLLNLKRHFDIKGFVEDRRATLETVIADRRLNTISCYLANWGYLKPNDQKDLPKGIHLLKPETLATPLASWP